MARRASVAVDHRKFIEKADELRGLAEYVPAFAIDYRVLIAEMIAIQCFYYLEATLEAIAAKLVSGACYADGTLPIIVHPAKTADAALVSMRTIGRPKPKAMLKWNKAKEIRGNVKYVMDPNETFCRTCSTHQSRINELRIVRNHMAHNNAQTRKEFEAVVRRRLGAVPRRLQRAGAFVLRTSKPGVTILEEYIATMRAIVKDAGKA